MATLSISNTFSNGSTADASAVNSNFSDIQTWLNNRYNGTDTWAHLNVTGQIVSTATSNHFALSTTSNTLTLTVAPQVSSTQTWTIPDISTNGTFAALQGTQTFTGAKTFSAATGNPIHGTNTNDAASAGYVGEILTSYISTNTAFAATTQWQDLTSLSLTAGDWDVWIIHSGDVGSGSTVIEIGVSTETGNSFTNILRGSNSVFCAIGTVSGGQMTIPISVASTTIYYFKRSATFSTTAPNGRGTMAARRRR